MTESHLRINNPKTEFTVMGTSHTLKENMLDNI